MTSKNKFQIGSILGFALLSLGQVFGQAPASYKITAKLRDFLEINPSGAAPAHPDFNNDKFLDCSGKGYVDQTISTNGDPGDSTIFPNDNRTIHLVKTTRSDGQACYTSIPVFEDWYNDKPNNRPFLVDLTFNRLPSGLYEFNATGSNNFFPLDPGGGYYNLPGNNLATYGQLQTCGGCTGHNFGFTMELHTSFTYLAGTNQVFNFNGDDDVWAYINGKLAIDLGGLHSSLGANINLDNVAAQLGLQNNNSYPLDFFYAERHVTASHALITTSLVLGTQTVATPVATPGTSSFTSQISVSLATATPGATIYYTTNGSTPDSTSQVYVTGTPLSITGTTTVKAIAYKPGWLKSAVMTETYTKTFVASTLEILDQNGNPLTGGYLTELNSAYSVRVTTTQAGLSSITPIANTKVDLDQETLTLGSVTNVGDRFVFTNAGPLPFSTGSAATANNGKTEAQTYDSLTVRWVNPKDANDVAVQKVLVRPAPKQARAYFSTKADGSDTTDQYQGTESKIYLVVMDEVLPSGVTPTVTLETTPKNGSGRTPDTETFNLVAVSPGKYIAAIPVSITPTSVPGNHTLELSVEDLIKGTYSDPMDTEAPAVANAGFGIAPEIDASLQFTDKNFNILPAGVYYSPAEGNLYLTYSDDWVNGQIGTKQVTLTIDNGKAPADAETLSVALVLSKHKGSTGVWEGSIPLKDLPNPTPNNHTAETYVLGKVHATVTSHNKAGTALTPVSDDLLVAYPNENPTITLEGPKGPGVEVTRADSAIKIVIHDQPLSSGGKDTIYATLTCTENQDVIANVMLIEKDGAPGTYESTIISKTEGASVVDGVLQCKSPDNIKVTYVDPVYGDPKEYSVLISDPVTTQLYFSASKTDSSQIGSVSESDAKTFYAVVIARSPTVNKVDTIMVTFTTPQGEKETFPAIETGPYTQKFVAEVPFGFVTGSVVAGNKTLEGKITPTDVNNRVTATASVTVDGADKKSDIILIAAYDPVVKAYIKDADGNGTADHVYIVFEKKLPRLPASLDAQWDSTASVFKTAPKLSFLDADSTIVVADYSTAAFPPGYTSIADGQSPKAKLPSDPLFANQAPAIDDSIGPILLSAVKHPANVNNLTPGDPSFNLDTLIITLSEPIKSATDFKQVLKFSTSCSDYANAKTIVAYNNPTADPNNSNKYTIIVDNSGSAVPLTNNCIFLNTNGNYTDIPGNLPPQLGIKLGGDDRDRIIQLFRGYPPVAGMNPNRPGFQVAVQDTRDPSKGGYSQADASGYNVYWIPPVDFDSIGAFNGKATHGPIPANVTDPSSGELDGNNAIPLPEYLSTIQVITTAAYVADVSIFDNLGNFVVSFKQAFGYRGELGDVHRVVPKGLVSYLWWDTRDKHGQFAGQGVYVWKVVFRFQNGKQEIQYTRTGLMRRKVN